MKHLLIPAALCAVLAAHPSQAAGQPDDAATHASSPSLAKDHPVGHRHSTPKPASHASGKSVSQHDRSETTRRSEGSAHQGKAAPQSKTSHHPVTATPAKAPHARRHAAVPAHAHADAVAPVPAAAVVAPAPAKPVPTLDRGATAGLPLPRFAALRSEKVVLRKGPGKQFPIDWVYQRRYLPVQIVREFDQWRLIDEWDGTKGWINESMLTRQRGFIINGDQPQTMRDRASDTAPAVAILKPGVVGQLVSCQGTAGWCQIKVQQYKGWLPRTAFWGTLPDETVQP